MISNLQPISKGHSISRVIASLHIPQVFLKPDLEFEKAKVLPCLSNYQRKSLTNVKTIDFKAVGGIVSSKDELNGFIFEEFNSEGSLNNILRLQNDGDKLSSIRFENKIYTDWDDFLPRFILDIGCLSEKIDIYISAISLVYVDEFIWNGDDPIAVNEIFNVKSELLNKQFLNSENGTVISITQDKSEDLESVFEEKIEVSFNNIIKRISINHHCLVRPNKTLFYTKEIEENIKESFNLAHERNKLALKDVLSEMSQKLIDLK